MDDDYWSTSGIKSAIFNENSDEEADTDDFMGTTRGEVALLSKTIKPDISLTLRKDDDTIVDEGSRPGGNLSVRYRSPDVPLSVKTAKDNAIAKSVSSTKTQRQTAAELDLPPEKMIWRIIMGEPFSLDIYKSKQQKLALLDYALKTHDGNAITAVILFIKNTLKQSLFHQILRENPTALDHYLSFLKSEQEYNKLSDILSMVGRSEEVAILNWKLALRSNYLKTRIQEMNKCYTNYFSSDPLMEAHSSLVLEHISLLERQAPIEAADEVAQKQRNIEIFQRFPKTHTLINCSVITTLYYCCLYHYGLTENHLASPIAIRKAHRLTDKQFIWTAVTARARLQRWTDIDSLMFTKTLFGAPKIKFIFSPEQFIELLKHNKSSREVLSKYINHIDNSELKLKLAKKCECHKLVVDLLSAVKDRVQLESYKSKLPEDSSDRQYAQDALSSSTIRWKN